MKVTGLNLLLSLFILQTGVPDCPAGPVECIKAGVEFVYVDLGVYLLSETLDVPSGVQIFCAPGAVFEAAPEAFKGVQDSLVTIRGANVSIYNCTFRMLRDTYTLENGYPPSEWRHAVHLVGASNIHLYDVHVESSGGDGVCIDPMVNGDFSENHFSSKDITIQRLTADRNYRTGISIISCVNCHIMDCELWNTKGISTQTGLIIEPAHGGDRASEINIERCHADNNGGSAYRINLDRLDQHSQPISIIFCCSYADRIPEGHQLIEVNNFAWNLNAVKPLGTISWGGTEWKNP